MPADVPGDLAVVRLTARSVLGVAEFRGLSAAYLQSTIGDQFAAVAVALLVYERTNSAAWTAAAYSLTMLPSLVSGVALSWIADRYPRRTVMLACAWLEAALLAVMAMPATPLVGIVALLVAVQLVQTPYAAAQTASLPAILDGRTYPAGQAFFDSFFNIGQLTGLALGGIVVSAVGSHAALGIDAITCVVSAIAIQVVVRRRPAPVRPPPGSPAATTSLVRMLRVDPCVLPLIALVWIVSFAVVPEGLAVPLASTLHATWAVGLLLAVDPAANLVGLFVLGRWVGLERRLRLIGVLCLLSVAPLLLFFLPLGLAPALAVLVVIGFAGAYHTSAKASLNVLVPDLWRGRVFGFIRVGLRAGQGLGIAVGGLVASATHSPRTAIALAGCAGLIAAVAPALTWHRLVQEQVRRPPGSQSGLSG